MNCVGFLDGGVTIRAMRTARADPLLDAQVTVATLQSALNRAQGRIHELETTCASMAERMSVATERAEHLEMRLATLADVGSDRVERATANATERG
jgi:chromosome segregation ATPase